MQVCKMASLTEVVRLLRLVFQPFILHWWQKLSMIADCIAIEMCYFWQINIYILRKRIWMVSFTFFPFSFRYVSGWNIFSILSNCGISWKKPSRYFASRGHSVTKWTYFFSFLNTNLPLLTLLLNVAKMEILDHLLTCVHYSTQIVHKLLLKSVKRCTIKKDS